MAMDEAQFNKLIKPDLYQVFFFRSKVSLPASMFAHTWVVTNDRGTVNRWDAWNFKERCKTSWGHLHLNLYKPLLGVRVFHNKKADPDALRFKGHLFATVEGGAGSLAERMVKFVNSSNDTYPYLHEYRYFPGPNSNTYTQWIVSHFPECDVKIPWNAAGKGFGI
jgi:hypothetical protein